MIINAAIQVVPLAAPETALPLVDKAIALIQKSGIRYTVGPFETTLEGTYEDVQQLLRALEDFCYGQKETPFLIYTKMHLCGGQDIFASSKTDKFKPA